MRKEDQFKVEYEDEDERDKLLKKWSDVVEVLLNKLNILKKKREAKAEALEG